MTEMVILVRTQPEDAISHSTHHRRGDVIEVGADHTNWGREVMRSPHFRILRVVTKSEAEVEMLRSFLGPQLATYPHHLGTPLHRRAYYFDCDSAGMPGPMQGWLANARRRVPVYETKMSAAEIVARFKKPRASTSAPWLAGVSR